jgi:teichoic acid transport system permease protein
VTAGPGPAPDLSGLQPLARRPSLAVYLRELWQRRDFTLALSAARLRAENSQDALGSLWQVLNPLLLAAVYFVVFGLILRTDRGIENFIAYLTIGVLVFTVCNRSAQAGATALVTSQNLTRALHFPHAVLPVAAVLVVTASLLPGLLVMAVTALATGEPVRPHWLLVLPALALQLGFNVGVALLLARLTARVHDLRRALPFFLRAWLYFSGVFYSIDRFVDSPGLRVVLEANPAYVFMTLVRWCFVESVDADATTWLLGVGWAVGAVLVGMLVFWAGEGGERPGHE